MAASYVPEHSTFLSFIPRTAGLDPTKLKQIKGEIVARVSAYFGFDLPVTFPYYQSGNAGQPVQNPLATPIP